jgi:hypothetical protein
MAVLKQSQLLERRALDAEDRGDFSEAHDLRVAKQKAVDWEKRAAENTLNRDAAGERFNQGEVGRQNRFDQGQTATESRFTRSQAAAKLAREEQAGRVLSQQEYNQAWKEHDLERQQTERDIALVKREEAAARRLLGEPGLAAIVNRIGALYTKRDEITASMKNIEHRAAQPAPTTQPSTMLPPGPASYPPAPGTPMQPDETGYDNQPPPSPDRYTSAAGDQGIPAPEGTVISGPNGQTFQKRNGQWVPYP